MEPTTYGIVSIVPVIVLIVVALITKRTFESLLIATLLALILGYKGDWFYALIEQIQTVSAENVWVLLVVGLLGGLVGVLEKSRAAMGFTGVLSRFATTKKRSLLAEWLLSVVLFVDDYLNILATGSITKRLNDSHRIHRTMTAYVIGSTSAPVVVLIPLSSWSIYYASLIDTTNNRTYSLASARLLMGRESKNDIVVHDINASRTHAELRFEPQGVWTITDLGSTNGTFVNGREIGTQLLREGDHITIGMTNLVFDRA